jgi:molybdopterin synthase sulfur carrier subunit
MKINFYATLRQTVGGKTIDFPEAVGMTVQKMVDALLARYPKLRPHLCAPDGALYPHVHIFINGRDAQHLEQGMDSILGADDTINIFPPVGGGSDVSATQFETIVRGVPLWLLREYVEQIGGQIVEGEWLTGAGWQARLTQAEDYEIGSLRVGQVRLELRGEAEAVEHARRALAPKLLRGGG